MKKKRLLIPVIIAGLFSLTACNPIETVQDFFKDLVNEDALSYSNHYNPPASTKEEDPNAVKARGVIAKDITETPNVYCFKNIGYGVDEKVTNTYKTGGVNENEFNVNNGEDYYSSKSNNNYDLYVPKDLNKEEKNTVILFIHGGAWVSGFKTDVNAYVHEFANRGYITATIKYTLLNREMNDRSLSIFRNLDEIDACITSIKAALVDDLGFTASNLNLVIGGASSGAHLAMLYSYSRGNNSALPIKFIVDAVGPVNIKPDCWKSFKYYSGEEEQYNAALEAGIEFAAIEQRKAEDRLGNLRVADPKFNFNWNNYQTMRIANGMCGIPYSLETVEQATDENKEEITNPTNEAAVAMTKVGGGEDQLSVTYYMSATNKIPMVCAYAGKDGVVGVAQFANLQESMDLYGIDYEFFYFKDRGHTDIDKDATQYQKFVKAIDDRCKAL